MAYRWYSILGDARHALLDELLCLQCFDSPTRHQRYGRYDAFLSCILFHTVRTLKKWKHEGLSCALVSIAGHIEVFKILYTKSVQNMYGLRIPLKYIPSLKRSPKLRNVRARD